MGFVEVGVRGKGVWGVVGVGVRGKGVWGF